MERRSRIGDGFLSPARRDPEPDLSSIRSKYMRGASFVPLEADLRQRARLGTRLPVRNGAVLIPADVTGNIILTYTPADPGCVMMQTAEPDPARTRNAEEQHRATGGRAAAPETGR